MLRPMLVSLVTLSVTTHAATLVQRDKALDVMEAQVRNQTTVLRKLCARLSPAIAAFNKDNGVGDQRNVDLGNARVALVQATKVYDSATIGFKASFDKLHEDIGSLQAAQEYYYNRANVQKTLDTTSALLDTRSDQRDAVSDTINSLGDAIEAYLKDFRVGLPGNLTLAQAFARFDALVGQFESFDAEVKVLEKKVAQLTIDMKSFPSTQELLDRITMYTNTVSVDGTNLASARTTLAQALGSLRSWRATVARLQQIANVLGDHTLPPVCKSL